MPLIDTRVPLIAVSCLAQSWSVVPTPATAETHRTIAIAPVQIDGSACATERKERRAECKTGEWPGSGRVSANLGESFLVGSPYPRGRRGTGVSHAGARLLSDLADSSGLTEGLSVAMAPDQAGSARSRPWPGGGRRGRDDRRRRRRHLRPGCPAQPSGAVR